MEHFGISFFIGAYSQTPIQVLNFRCFATYFHRVDSSKTVREEPICRLKNSEKAMDSKHKMTLM
jgi:hypothetical protein